MQPRLLVTGSRTWDDFKVINNALAYWWRFVAENNPEAVLVHGDCPKGADRLAKNIWAGQNLPTEAHPADWNLHGKAAGIIRNTQMVALGATTCYAFIKDNSPGATHCANIAEKAGIYTVRFTK